MTSPAGASASNVRFLSRNDQGGRPDGVQVILHKGHAFIGHMFSDGYSVVDVRDPLNPKTVAFIAAPKNTRSHHLQIHGDVLLAVNGPNIWAMQQYATQQDYYAKSLIDSVQTEQPFAAGLRVFDVSNPATPREIAFLHMPGFGAHRIWWVGGRYAYVSVHFEGFIDHALAIIDVSDPTQAKAGRSLVAARHEPCRRRNPSRFVRQAHGAASSHKRRKSRLRGMARRRLHHSRSERSGEPEAAQPSQLRAALWRRCAYAFAAAKAASCWCLADEATSANCANGLAYTWLIDVREPSNPVSIATLPTPAEEDFCAKGAKFGPHNLHENRPGALQTEDLVFATYHNAGLRIYDVRDAFPAQTGRLLRAAAAGKNRRPAAKPGQGHPVLRRLCRQKRTDVPHRHQCGLYILQYEGN